VKLAEQRWHFSFCIGELLGYARSNGYLLVLDEGRVFKKRKTRRGGIVEDGIHIPTSKHYEGLAQDTILYDSFFQPIYKDCPMWQDLGRFWKSLDPECTWGGDFKKVDLNHFSWGEK
jgi:hypothetical protein